MAHRGTFRITAALLCWIGCLSGQTSGQPSAARSVHLTYSGPRSTVFYNELTVDETTPGSYFMACGFRHGYFGIQDLGPRRSKVVLFSVWDPGTTYKADDVLVRRFGGEEQAA